MPYPSPTPNQAFFYASAESLEWAQRLMLKLWSYLLQQAEIQGRYRGDIVEI